VAATASVSMRATRDVENLYPIMFQLSLTSASNSSTSNSIGIVRRDIEICRQGRWSWPDMLTHHIQIIILSGA
jgi:hypothetical protein